jgi:hypothetical protein
MLEGVIAFYFAAPYTASVALALVLDGCCLWALRSGPPILCPEM